MRFSSACVGASAFLGLTSATCFFPEPSDQICYNTNGATPQNLDVREVAFIAKYLRAYQTQATAQGLTTKGGTWALAKLVGDNAAAVTFNDIANTIDGGVSATPAQVAQSLTNCGTAGGQMSVIVNATDPLYSGAEFVGGGYTNQGIVIKLVHAPSDKLLHQIQI
ncbi:hypothetical protein ANO14919_078100 [Xylariales sp. No.14919]|nr:hypothetical protein ANO14919_078100 [Xylariales sp. No.14919]